MKCKICKKTIIGRSDKIFCSVQCKNDYHTHLRRVNQQAVQNIDIILHRNRSILLEILGKNKVQAKVNRIVLEKKKFLFKYHTHMHVNSKGKTYYHLYDFAYMEFSDDSILIVKR
jgi:hypothetical protein